MTGMNWHETGSGDPAGTHSVEASKERRLGGGFVNIE